jgi:acyl carrier protein
VDEGFVELLRSFLPLLGDQPLTEDAWLRDLGLDSIQAVDLLHGIESSFGISLPDEDLTDTTFATAGRLWRAVSALLPSSTESLTATRRVS